MFSLTRKSEYALIALTYLGQRRQNDEKPASARQIAETFDMPIALLMNILKELCQARLVNSTRGMHGGYELAVEPRHVRLLEIVTAIEGPVQFTQCSNSLPILGRNCSISKKGCPISRPVRRLQKRFNSFLEAITLENILADFDGDDEDGKKVEPAGSRRSGKYG